MQTKLSTFMVTLVGTLSLALAMGVGRFAFTPLLPMMQVDGLISLAQSGWLAASNYLGYLVGALTALNLPLSRVANIRLSLIALSLSTYLMGSTDNMIMWFLWRFISGLTCAWIMVLISSWCLAALHNKHATHHSGWIYAGVGLGIAIVGLYTLWLMLEAYSALQSWRSIGIVTGIISVLLCITIEPDKTHTKKSQQANTKSNIPSCFQVRLQTQQRRLFICYVVCGFGYIIPATYLPVQAKAMINDPAIFGWAWPAFGVTAMLSTIIASKLNRYVSDQTLWTFSHITMGLGVLISIIFPGILPVMLSAFMVGGSFMVAVMYAMRIGQQQSDQFLAIMVVAFSLGQLVGPLVASVFLFIGLGLKSVSLLAAILLLVSAAYLNKPIDAQRITD